MANICVAEIAFYTDFCNSNELEKLFKILTRVKNDKSYNETAVSKELGFEMHNNLTLGYSIDILDLSVQSFPSEKLSYFRIALESSGLPKMGIFDEILSCLKDIKYALFAEEPGDEIYINTDIEHLFFNVEYKMEIPLIDDAFAGLPNHAFNFLGLNGRILKNSDDYLEYFDDEYALLDAGRELFARKFESIHEMKYFAGILSKLFDVNIGVFEYAWDLKY